MCKEFSIATISAETSVMSVDALVKSIDAIASDADYTAKDLAVRFTALRTMYEKMKSSDTTFAEKYAKFPDYVDVLFGGRFSGKTYYKYTDAIRICGEYSTHLVNVSPMGHLTQYTRLKVRDKALIANGLTLGDFFAYV